MGREVIVDVAVVGAGPAGLAAAMAVAKAGKKVALIDENPSPGGQIWRASTKGLHPDASEAFWEIGADHLEWISGGLVYDATPNTLFVETATEAIKVHAKNIILATGASERFVPFPGWTLPNVVGVGAMQALVKSGLEVKGKKIVIAGTGPLLLAVAFQLELRNALVEAVVEQASLAQLFRFGVGLMRHPEKLRQAVTMGAVASKSKLGRWVVEATGKERLESVTLSGGTVIECDYLACAYGLSPNTELAQLLGCRIQDEFVWVDEIQETSVPGVFCAGEPTSIGGVELSLAEGAIAGYAASGQPIPNWCSRQKAKQSQFAQLLDRTFRIREEIQSLAKDDTIVCRCEDVRWEQLRLLSGAREAKLQTRCGMGPCQGKICGNALRFMKGWETGTIRPPLKPVSVKTLLEGYGSEEK